MSSSHHCLIAQAWNFRMPRGRIVIVWSQTRESSEPLSRMNQEKTMIKRVLAVAMAGILAHTIMSAPPAFAATKEEKEACHAEKVRAGIAKLGTGASAIVAVKLRDKSHVAGFVSKADDSGFTVTDAKTGTSVPVTYADVTKVKGHNLSTGAKIGIGIAIGFLLTAAIVFLSR